MVGYLPEKRGLPRQLWVALRLLSHCRMRPVLLGAAPSRSALLGVLTPKLRCDRALSSIWVFFSSGVMPREKGKFTPVPRHEMLYKSAKQDVAMYVLYIIIMLEKRRTKEIELHQYRPENHKSEVRAETHLPEYSQCVELNAKINCPLRSE
jgi:hypothetical protein